MAKDIQQSTVICKTRKKKRSFSIIDNCAIDDLSLSIEALGVYNVFKRWSTFEAEDFVCSKSFIQSKSRCGDKKFERVWKELKEKGYIKMYCVGKSTWTAELLEEPEPDTPHTLYLNAEGVVKRTVGGTAKTEENSNPPQKGGDLENPDLNPPHLRGDLESGDLTSGDLTSRGLKGSNNINTSFKNSFNNSFLYNDYQSINPSEAEEPKLSSPLPNEKKIDRVIDNELIEEIKEQIGYESFIQGSALSDIRVHADDLDIVLDILATLKTANKPMQFGDSIYQPDYIRARADKIDYSHIEYVFECFYEHREEVRNIKKYLMTAVFNAPATCGSYYSNRVRVDGLI